MNPGSHGGRTAASGNAARQAWSGSPPMLSEVRCASFPDRHFELVEKSLVSKAALFGMGTAIPTRDPSTPSADSARDDGGGGASSLSTTGLAESSRAALLAVPGVPMRR